MRSKNSTTVLCRTPPLKFLDYFSSTLTFFSFLWKFSLLVFLKCTHYGRKHEIWYKGQTELKLAFFYPNLSPKEFLEQRIFPQRCFLQLLAVSWAKKRSLHRLPNLSQSNIFAQSGSQQMIFLLHCPKGFFFTRSFCKVDKLAWKILVLCQHNFFCSASLPLARVQDGFNQLY